MAYGFVATSRSRAPIFCAHRIHTDWCRLAAYDSIRGDGPSGRATVDQADRCCRRLHGHSYRVEVQLDGPVDAHAGFVVDFFDVEKGFADTMGALDHRCLNDVAGLENPTAENIAIWIWDRLKPDLPQISGVRVDETADCWEEYDGR